MAEGEGFEPPIGLHTLGNYCEQLAERSADDWHGADSSTDHRGPGGLRIIF